ncbi:MAG: lipopolysaccharide assembly protein LapB [Thiogranum sp.]
MQALLWLLLPIAAASGWWMARYSETKKKTRSRAMLNSAYGQGLNYLLNEQADKASEVLIQMVEVDPDTVELHLALGSLFRQRGEVDQAIAVHQNIIARSTLSGALRNQASLELGRDFLKAGLLDRAEQLLLNLLKRKEYEKVVCQYLIELYQQVKEWRKALAIGERLVALDSDTWKPLLAQYHCEISETALQGHDFDLALQEADQARIMDPDCVRATLLLGDVYQFKGDYSSAIETYRYVEEQNPRLMPEVTGKIQNCYKRLGHGKSWEDYLGGLVERHGHLKFLLKKHTGQQCQALALKQPRYRCDECGFTSRKLFWQCPGCLSWSSVKPIAHECGINDSTLRGAL